MNGYSFALFVHFLSLLLAVAATSLNLQSALILCSAADSEQAFSILQRTRRFRPLFPLATLGLLGSGGFMIHTTWQWTNAWVCCSIAGLLMIVVLGAGVEGSRMRALGRELASGKMTAGARRLQSDPLAWSARFIMVGLIIAVVFLMTTKPRLPDALAILCAAIACGALSAIPLWTSEKVVMSPNTES